jgi:hypothetical protein
VQTMYYIWLDVHKRTVSSCAKDRRGTIHAQGTISAPQRVISAVVQEY